MAAATRRPLSFSFNGAALFQVRIIPPSAAALLGVEGLQWGRTFSSADNNPHHDAAFFEARLQWGRTFSSADNTAKLDDDAVTDELQWGRTFSSADN